MKTEPEMKTKTNNQIKNEENKTKGNKIERISKKSNIFFSMKIKALANVIKRKTIVS